MRGLLRGWRYVVGGVVLAAAATGGFLAFYPSGAGTAGFGAGGSKRCASPTLVGQLDKCIYGVQNLDAFGNTQLVNFVEDQVFTFSHGSPTSLNVFSSVG